MGIIKPAFMAAWTYTKALAALVVVLAVAVHSAEVQTLDEVDARTAGVATPGGTGGVPAKDGTGGVPAAKEEAPKKKKFRFNRASFFHGDIDSDEASLDNGDDTNLLEMWEGAMPKAPKDQTAADRPMLGESVDTTQQQQPPDEKVTSDNSETTEAPKQTATPTSGSSNSSSMPDLPQISPLDEKYMPAIMDKLIKMRDEMAALKGANWEEILEEHRDGVVQIMVVKKKFMWKAVYRAPLSERFQEVGGSSTITSSQCTQEGTCWLSRMPMWRKTQQKSTFSSHPWDKNPFLLRSWVCALSATSPS